MVVDFTDREELDAWVTDDPYVAGGVWRDLMVREFRRAAGR